MSGVGIEARAACHAAQEFRRSVCIWRRYGFSRRKNSHMGVDDLVAVKAFGSNRISSRLRRRPPTLSFTNDNETAVKSLDACQRRDTGLKTVRRRFGGSRHRLHDRILLSAVRLSVRPRILRAKVLWFRTHSGSGVNSLQQLCDVRLLLDDRRRNGASSGMIPTETWSLTTLLEWLRSRTNPRNDSGIHRDPSTIVRTAMSGTVLGTGTNFPYDLGNPVQELSGTTPTANRLMAPSMNTLHALIPAALQLS